MASPRARRREFPRWLRRRAGRERRPRRGRLRRPETHKTDKGCESRIVAMNLNDLVVKRGVDNDVAWIGRLLADSVDPAHASCAPTAWLCVSAYSSLIVHESYAKLKTSDPALAALVSGTFEDVVKRSRHSLKLFEDTGTNVGINGQCAYFRDEVIPAHEEVFIGRVPRIARFLAKDLGLTSYDGRLIATTHGMTFHFGMAPADLLVKKGPDIATFTEHYGRYYKHLGAQIPATGNTFLARLDPAAMGTRDVRAKKYYGGIFDGPGGADLNALLTVLRGMVNFAAFAVPVADAGGSVDYTEFKIRFVTAYQVLSSLQVLRDDTQRTLTPRSRAYLARILDTAEVQVLLDPSTKPFRNTLVHYGLDSRVPPATVDLADPVFGLAPHYFSACGNVSDLAKLVDRSLTDTATAMDEWAEQP
jgi:hypothetical protein